MQSDYDLIEQIFGDLKKSLELSFLPAEIHEIQHLINVGEYEIAIKFVVDIIELESRMIASKAHYIIETLYDMMDKKFQLSKDCVV